MKILCITNQEADYLADSFILGCKLSSEFNTEEFEVKKILYNSSDISEVRGFGFSLYNILPPSFASSCLSLSKENLRSYDLIVFTSIYRQFDTFLKIYPELKYQNTIVLDGEDKGNVFLYAGRYWKNPLNWFRPKPHKKLIYFKREITELTNYSLYYKLIPKSLINRFKLHSNILPISFAIPREKISKINHEKSKNFPKHIVDAEIAEKIEGSSTQYGFNSEKEYYNDLQKSKFGITTKRGGWDCLRHYEIAANGAVICFKNLENKPKLCAPHGLIPNFNCISYSNYDDLMNQIKELSDEEYRVLQLNSFMWIEENTCENLAKNVINLSLEKMNQNKKVKLL